MAQMAVIVQIWAPRHRIHDFWEFSELIKFNWWWRQSIFCLNKKSASYDISLYDIYHYMIGVGGAQPASRHTFGSALSLREASGEFSSHHMADLSSGGAENGKSAKSEKFCEISRFPRFWAQNALFEQKSRKLALLRISAIPGSKSLKISLVL